MTENEPAGTTILQVTAADPDDPATSNNGLVSFAITGNRKTTESWRKKFPCGAGEHRQRRFVHQNPWSLSMYHSPLVLKEETPEIPLILIPIVTSQQQQIPWITKQFSCSLWKWRQQMDLGWQVGIHFLNYQKKVLLRFKEFCFIYEKGLLLVHNPTRVTQWHQN